MPDYTRTENDGSPHVTPGVVEMVGDAARPQQPVELAPGEPAAGTPPWGEQLKRLYLPLLAGKPDGAQADAVQAGAVPVAKSTDMKILVIAADGSETDYPYICATLDQLGIQYDILLAATQPLVPEILSDGANHGYCQGIILVTGNLGYYDAASNSWPSGFDTLEWATLWAYETAFGVRQVTSYTLPGSLPDSYGLNYVTYQDTTNQPLTATFTDAGKQVYADLNTGTPVTFRNAWVYLGTVVNAAFNSACCAGARVRGEPPLCSNARPAGPCRRNASVQAPIVCASRSSASPTCAAVQPRANTWACGLNGHV